MISLDFPTSPTTNQVFQLHMHVTHLLSFQVAVVSFALVACTLAYPRYIEPQYQASEHVSQHYEGYQGQAEERLSFAGHHNQHHQLEEHHDDEHVDYFVS